MVAVVASVVVVVEMVVVLIVVLKLEKKDSQIRSYFEVLCGH